MTRATKTYNRVFRNSDVTVNNDVEKQYTAEEDGYLDEQEQEYEPFNTFSLPKRMKSNRYEESKQKEEGFWREIRSELKQNLRSVLTELPVKICLYCKKDALHLCVTCTNTCLCSECLSEHNKSHHTKNYSDIYGLEDSEMPRFEEFKNTGAFLLIGFTHSFWATALGDGQSWIGLGYFPTKTPAVYISSRGLEAIERNIY
jgi:hypothetical protein